MWPKCFIRFPAFEFDFAEGEVAPIATVNAFLTVGFIGPACSFAE